MNVTCWSRQFISILYFEWAGPFNKGYEIYGKINGGIRSVKIEKLL
jgi:hypothetical protein